MRRQLPQLSLDFRAHGGARKGAGRKRSSKRARHVSRPEHKPYHPVHVTMRAVREVGNLRGAERYQTIRRCFEEAWKLEEFRVVHFSVQSTHLHVLVEASDKASLWRRLRGLEIRIAKRLNELLGRKGKAFADRYHARALKTPRETRNCLAYVLSNHRHHAQQRGIRLANEALDPCSSAAYFDGWAERPATSDAAGAKPVARAQTWLIARGWRRAGPISMSEIPGAG